MMTYRALSRHPGLLLVVALFASGCLPPPEQGGGENVEVLSEEEIQNASLDGSAYELIETLRPQWLESRGPTSAVNDPITGSEPNFYVERSQVSASEVRSIQAAQVQRVVALSAGQANIQFGSGNENGAIVFYLK
jgi:hypothetical protein